MSWCLRLTITQTQEVLPSPRASGTATCESQGQPSSCHPGETSEFLPASGDRSGGYPGQRTGRPAAGRVEREVSGPPYSVLLKIPVPLKVVKEPVKQ